MYQIALFTHIIGVICLMCGRALLHTGLGAMSRARTMEGIRGWAAIFVGLTRLMPLFALVILLAGLYMAWTSWGFTTPWIDASLGVFLVVIVLNVVVLRRNIVALAREVKAVHSETIPASLTALIRNRAVWITEHGITGLLLAIVFLMAVKPPLMWAVVTLSIGLIAGLLSTVLVSQSAPTVSAPSASPQREPAL